MLNSGGGKNDLRKKIESKILRKEQNRALFIPLLTYFSLIMSPMVTPTE
jgi:hypothetical protein